jgi:hypothetical protein
MTPGLQTYLRPALGGARMEVDLAPFAAAGPLKEARYLQSSAIAHHRYRRYHLISILLQRFHGRPAALWTFWWKPLNWPRRDVREIIFTAQTAVGPQPYIVSMAAPAAAVAYASHILRVAIRTFSPLT